MSLDKLNKLIKVCTKVSAQKKQLEEEEKEVKKEIASLIGVADYTIPKIVVPAGSVSLGVRNAKLSEAQVEYLDTNFKKEEILTNYSALVCSGYDLSKLVKDDVIKKHEITVKSEPRGVTAIIKQKLETKHRPKMIDLGFYSMTVKPT